MTPRISEGVALADDGSQAARARGAAFDDFFATILALSAGALVLVLVLLQYLAKGIGEPEEQKVYLFVWPLALASAVLIPRALEFAQGRWLRRSDVFWPFLGLGHAAFWAVWIGRVHAIEAETGPARARDLAEAFRCISLGLPAMTLALFAGFVVGGRYRSRLPAALHGRGKTIGEACVVMTTAALAWLAVQFSQTAYSNLVLLSFLGLAGVLAATTRAARLAPIAPRRFVTLTDALVLGGLVLLLWFPETPEGTHGSSLADFAQIWTSHYNFLLGPVEGILQGRSPLVDANSQYGVGIAYFIALVFRLDLVDRSTHGLAHLICALEVIRFFLLYLAMKRLTRSVLPAMLFLGAGLAINVYAPQWTYFRLPNEGPLRFVVEYSLVVALAFQPRGRVDLPLATRIGVLFLVALGALWSPDMAIATVGAYLGTRALVALGSTRSLRARVAAFARDAGNMAAALGLAVALLALHVRATTGVWPIWSRAFEYVAFYRTWTGWSVPVAAWAMWLPVGLVYLGSVAALVRRMDTSVEAQAVLAMSLVGIAEMNYYVGRSLIENLAAVSLPAVFVGAYWLAQALRGTKGAIRLSAGTAGYAAATILIFTGIPGFVSKVPFSLLVQAARATDAQPWAHSAEALEAAALLAKYAPMDRRVAVFMRNDAEVEALLVARKTQLWPFGYHEQDGLLPRARQAAIDFEAPLHAGDVVFAGLNLTTPAAEAYEKLTREFELAELEKTPTGIRALRVTGRK